MIALIPAFEPGDALPQLVTGLLAADPDIEIVVIDDGSGERYRHVFAQAHTAGATVLAHAGNQGKGAALKTGFQHVLDDHPGDDVVTADADGQHTVADIVAIADELRADAASGTPALILGCRTFAGRVPVRSRLGNAAARSVFRVATGWRLSDTQTGLRGIPSEMLPWLIERPGERFEYEQNVLLHSRGAGWSTREAPIETVYLDHNASSHFRPIADSLRVAMPLLAFAGSSLIAFAVDTVALLLFTALTGALVPSIIAARVLSASVNFAVNRRVVFQQRARRDLIRQLFRYALLAAALLASNVVWMTALTGFGIPILLAKIATEIVLFVTSYGVQKSFVFTSQDAGHSRPGPVIGAQTPHSNRIAGRGRVGSDAFTTGRNHS